MSVDFDPSDSYFTPIRGQLTSFGSQADGKAIKRNSVTFQGNAGAGWVTINSDEYHVRRKSGYIDIRQVDDDGDLVDWQTYFDYQTAGNTAFRATYTVKSGATETTYTNESVTMSEFDPYLNSGDGGFDGELPQNLFVQEIHAEFGEIGGWLLSSTTLTSDSGNVTFDSSVPSIAVGATGYQTGTGFWVGENGGAYKLYIGDATNKQMYWDGSALTAGGFTIGADYIRDAADSFGLASTVTGGDDVRFWAGAAFASRATAPFRVTEAGVVTATSGAIGGFDIGSDYIRDAANSFGLASTVTAGDDVRFWAGATYANRATAPLQLYESGLIFAKDIVLAKGSLTGASGATGYGYAVGEPYFLCHYDGAHPYETDFRGSAIGHNGQVDTRSGGVIFVEGIFGKAVQIAEATTNLMVNPSFETNLTGWGTSGTFATNSQSSAKSRYGSYSNKLVNSSGSDASRYDDFTATATTSTVSVWVYRDSGSGTITLSLQENFGSFTTIASSTASSTTGVWQRITATGATSIGSSYNLVIAVATGVTVYVDAAQAEGKAYITPYCDGSLGTGHSWSGTAHASSSSRTAATLTYPASGNINLVQGSLSFWAYFNATQNTTPRAFAVYIDANNYIQVSLATNANKIPYASSVSGGSGVSTSSGATALSVGWHHIVLTWTTGALKLYADGAQNGATATYVVPTGTATTMEIGTLASSNQANTPIDDLAILPYVLTTNEIKSIYYSTAPLMLGISNQEFRLSGAGLGDVFGNANGLFGRASDGTPSFGILNGTVNATTWGGASESFDSGDFMFGSNASGKSNLIFDASAGTLALRTATTKKIELQTDGDIFVGTDTSAASTTHLALFGASQTFDSNAGYEAGDILIGRSTASSASIIWDKSLGTLYFCYGAITNLASPSNLVMDISSNGLSVDAGFATAPSSLTVTSGNQAIDHAGTSFVIVGTSSGNWSVQHIKLGFTVGHRLVIWNNSANNVSFIRNNSGSPAAGYGKVYTLTGADVVPATGYCIMEFIYGSDTAGSEQWILLSVRPV